MWKFVFGGFLAGTLSLVCATTVLAEGDSASLEHYLQESAIQQNASTSGAASVAQVSSVSELSDVDPNSWAFQALKSLVERYGCIEGYPSKKYLGNRPLSRYEFAAGLNACLDKVGEQIAAATSNLATKDDLAAVQRLQEDFKVELATLRGRVDTLEAKTKELEAHQFSTTTKLDGSVVMAVQGGSAGGNVSPGGVFGGPFLGAAGTPGSAANTTFVGRTTLNLRASFTGKDELLIRLRGVTGEDISGTFPGIANAAGTLFYAGSGGVSYDGSTNNLATNGNTTVSFDKVRYTTTLFGDNFRIYVGPRIDNFEIIDTNSFANNEEVDFSNTFLINNPLIIDALPFDRLGAAFPFIFTGPGTGFDWKIGEQFSVRAIYIAGQGGLSNGFGLGGVTGSNSLGNAELEFRPSETSKIKLQYAGYTQQIAANTPTKTDAFGLNAEWAITPNVGVFGRYGTGTAKFFTPGIADANLTTWQFGFSFPGLFAPSNTLGISAGQPTRATNYASGTETDYELFYNFKLNDRITLTPDIQLISQPGNIAGNPTITIGSLRAVFSF
jgi:Carbohydrate-selective porin, OprB family/S-layer homology domain